MFVVHSLWDQEKRSKRNSSEIFGFFKKRLVEYSEIRNKLFTHKKIRNELWKSHWAKKPAVGWTQRPKTFLPKVARFFTQNMWPFQHFFLKVLHTLACQIIVQQNLIVFSKFSNLSTHSYSILQLYLFWGKIPTLFTSILLNSIFSI